MRTLLHFPPVRLIWRWLLLPLLVMVAVVLTLGRVGMASVDQYRSELEQLLSPGESYPLQIGRLQGGWHYLSPTLTVSRLVVGDAANPALRVATLEMELDLLATLWNRRPVARRLLLDGLDLGLTRYPDGRWQLAGGLDPGGQAGGTGAPDLMPLLRTLWLQREVAVRNARLQLNLSDREVQLQPQELELAWQHQAERQRLYARLGNEQEAGFILRGESSGQLGDEDFSGHYYLRSAWIQPQLWQQLLPPAAEPLGQVALAAELWGKIEGGSQWLGGILTLPQLEWQAAEGALLLTDFQTRLQWQREGRGSWQAQLSQIEGQLNGAALGVGDISLWGSGAVVNGVATSELALAPIWQQFQTLPLTSAELRERLMPLNPAGSLRNLRLGRPEGAGWGEWSLDADLDQVSVGAWHGAPEARHVNGRLRLDAEGGRVDLDSREFWLNFPALYRQGWQFDHATGAVTWQLDERAIRVESQLLSLGGREVNANGRFAIEIPRAAAGEDEGRLVLMIGMRDSNGALAPLFVPDQILDPALFRWLEGALNEGELRSGGLVYDAPLRRRDDSDGQPTLQMFFDTGATRLRYQAGWPAVQDADAFTLIKNSEVLVEVPRGRVYDETRIERAEVYLPPRSHRLEVRARLNGPAADGRLALLQSPIGSKLGEEFARWQVSGDLHTELNLGIDLDAFERSSIRVDSHLTAGEYWSPALNLRIEDITGAVHFDEREGLNSGVISARFFDRPLVAQIETEGQGEAATTRIRGWGGITMAAVRSWTDLPLIDAFRGETDYAFELKICGEKPGCSGLRLDSRLLGVVVDAPPPYAKRGGTAAPFTLELDLTPGYQGLRLHYPQLEAWLALQAGKLRGGEIALGRQLSGTPPRTDALELDVSLEQMALDQWRSFVETHFLAGRSITGPQPEEPGRVELAELNLRAERASYTGYQLQQLDARLRHQGDQWRLELSSREASGTMMLPATPGELVVADFSRLYLPAAEEEPGSADPLADFDPRTLFPLSLKIDDLRRGEQSYGRWQLDVRPDAGGAHFEAINARIRGLDLTGSLYWSYDGSRHETRTQLEAQAVNLGDVMTAWGSARSLETELARFDGDLSWQGSPAGFNWDTLGGSSTFHAERGRILDAGDRPVLKLFSLVNVSTLLRRLSLDFEDLTADGAFFDSMDFNVALNEGVATTSRPATLISPTYDLELAGDVDLAREQLDLSMLVQLPVAENLPIAAALLASPTIAGAVFLVERLIGKQLKRFTSVRYQLTGPWDQPNMELVSKPDDQRKPSKPLDADF